MRTIGRLLFGLGLAAGIETMVMADEAKTSSQPAQAESQLDEKTKEEIKRLNKEAKEYSDDKNYERAEQLYKKSLEVGESFKTYTSLGVVLYEWGDIEKSKGNLNHALNKYALAEEHFKKSLKLNSGSYLANHNYGVFLCDVRQDFKKAKDYLDKALSKKPDDSVTKAWRDVVREKIGE